MGKVKIKSSISIGRMRKRLTNTVIASALVLPCFTTSVFGKGFEVINTAPRATLGASVIQKKDVNIQVLTDYTGQKSSDIISKMNSFKNEMWSKGINVTYKVTDGATPDTTVKSPNKPIKLSSSSSTLMALSSDGLLRGLGLNSYQQLSNLSSTRSQYSVPVMQISKDIIDMKVVEARVIAMDKNRDVYQWGQVLYSTSGENYLANNPSKIVLPTDAGKPVSISAGNSHNLILTDSNKLFATGYNSDGQLGTAPNINPWPIQLSGVPANASKVVGGPNRTFVITSTGDAYAMGSNASGALGIGNTINKSSFTKVLLSDIKDIVCASDTNYTYFLTNSGDVYCASATSSTPYKISLPAKVYKIAVTSNIVAGIGSDGKIYSNTGVTIPSAISSSISTDIAFMSSKMYVATGTKLYSFSYSSGSNLTSHILNTIQTFDKTLVQGTYNLDGAYYNDTLYTLKDYTSSTLTFNKYDENLNSLGTVDVRNGSMGAVAVNIFKFGLDGVYSVRDSNGAYYAGHMFGSFTKKSSTYPFEGSGLYLGNSVVNFMAVRDVDSNYWQSWIAINGTTIRTLLSASAAGTYGTELTPVVQKVDNNTAYISYYKGGNLVTYKVVVTNTGAYTITDSPAEFPSSTMTYNSNNYWYEGGYLNYMQESGVIRFKNTSIAPDTKFDTVTSLDQVLVLSSYKSDSFKLGIIDKATKTYKGAVQYVTSKDVSKIKILGYKNSYVYMYIVDADGGYLARVNLTDDILANTTTLKSLNISGIETPTDNSVENIFVHMSDGEGNNFNQEFGAFYTFGNLTKEFVNGLAGKNYTAYSISKDTTWDYKLPDSPMQSATIKEMIGATPNEGKLYNSTVSGGLAQLDNLLNELGARLSQNVRSLYETAAGNGKKINVSVATDYTGQKLADLTSKLNQTKSELYDKGIGFNYNVSNASLVSNTMTDHFYKIQDVTNNRDITSEWLNMFHNYDYYFAYDSYTPYSLKYKLLEKYNTPTNITGLTDVLMVANSLETGRNATPSVKFALRRDGTVWRNTGNNTYVKIEKLNNIIQIVMVEQALLALDNNGVIWLWGNDSNTRLAEGRSGYLIDNSSDFNPTFNAPAYIPSVANVKQFINIGSDNGFAVLKDDGTVEIYINKNIVIDSKYSYDYSRGEYTNIYTLANNNASTPYKPNITNVKNLAYLENEKKLYFTMNDGSVKTMYIYASYDAKDKTNYPAGYFNPNAEPRYTNIAKLSIANNGEYYGIYAILNDGTVKVEGTLNYCSQFGLGHNSSSGYTTIPGLSNIIDIAHTPYYTLYLTESGDVYRSGALLSNGTFRNTTPAKEQISNVAKLAVTTDIIAAVTKDNKLYEWGYFVDGSGQSFYDKPKIINTPEGIKDVYLGQKYTIVSTLDNKYKYIGDIGALIPNMKGQKNSFTNLDMMNGYKVIAHAPGLRTYSYYYGDALYLQKINTNKYYGLGFSLYMGAASNLFYWEPVDVTNKIVTSPIDANDKILWLGVDTNSFVTYSYSDYTHHKIFVLGKKGCLTERTMSIFTYAEFNDGYVYPVGRRGLGWGNFYKYQGGSYNSVSSYVDTNDIRKSLITHMRYTPTWEPNAQTIFNTSYYVPFNVEPVLTASYAPFMDVEGAKSSLLESTDGSEKYFMFVSDAVGSDLTKGYSSYFAAPTLTNAFKDYLKNNKVRPFIVTDSANYDLIPDYVVNSKTQEVSLRQLSDNLDGRLFGKAEVEKALNTMSAKPLDIIVLTDYSGSKLVDLTNALNAFKSNTYSSNIDTVFNIVSDGSNMKMGDGGQYSNVVLTSAGAMPDNIYYIDSANDLYVKGDNSAGYLGLGDITNRNSYVKNPLITDVVGILAGGNFGSSAIALRKDGTVWAWGSYSYPSIGFSNTSGYTSSPRQITELKNIIKISQSKDGKNRFAIDVNNNLYSWGENIAGSAGHGSIGAVRTPKKVDFSQINNKVVDVIGTDTHTLILLNDKTVWAMGSDTYGQLGLGDSFSSYDYINGSAKYVYTPKQVPSLTNVKQIDAAMWKSGGIGTSFALKEDGTVYSWGSNEKSLGLGNSVTMVCTPTRITQLNGIRQIAAAITTSGSSVDEPTMYALDGSGMLWHWGDIDFNTLGPAPLYTPVQFTGITNVDTIIATSSRSTSFIKKSDGTWWARGAYNGLSNNNSTNQVTSLASIITSVAVPSAPNLYLKTVNANQVMTYTPRPNAQKCFLYISDGQGVDFSKPFGDYYGFGSLNTDLKNYLNTNDYSIYAVSPSADYDLKIPETLQKLSIRELVDSSSEGRLFNSGEYLKALNSITAKKLELSVLTDYAGSKLDNLKSSITRMENDLYPFNIDLKVNLVDGTNKVTYSSKTFKNAVVASNSYVSSNIDNFYHIDSTRSLYSIGKNANGQLGIGNTTDSLQYYVKNPTLTNVLGVVAGLESYSALRDDGTVWTWGNPWDFAFGISSLRGTGNIITPTQIPGLSNILKLTQSATGDNRFAIDRDLNLFSWGKNQYGTTGHGNIGGMNDPRKVGAAELRNNVVDVSGGYTHTLILRSDKTVWSLGDDAAPNMANTGGQLGLGNSFYGPYDYEQGYNKTMVSPRQVVGLTNVKQIAAGYCSSFALKEDGTVWAWGSNMDTYDIKGQLGLNNGSSGPMFVYQPTQIPNLSNIKQIELASNPAGKVDVIYALGNDGKVRAWGSGIDYTGFYKDAPPQIVPGLDNVVEIIPTNNLDTTFFILADGTTRILGRYRGAIFRTPGSASETLNALLSPNVSAIKTEAVDTSKIVSAKTTGKADKYFMYVSDGTGKVFSKPFGDYYSFGSLDNKLRDYLVNNKFNIFSVSSSSDYDTKLSAAETGKLAQELSIRELIGSSTADNKLFNLGEYQKAIDYILSKYQVLMDEKKSGYILIDEEYLVLSKSYDDYERDTSNLNVQYAERYEFAHDKDYFENSMGYFKNSIPMDQYNLGQHKWGAFSTTPTTQMNFDKVGRYIISYQAQDNPSKDNLDGNGKLPDESLFAEYRKSSLDRAENKLKIFVNRRPIANFSYVLDGINLSITNTSFDWDHLSLSNKGIAKTIFKYKKLSDSTWTIGNPPTVLEPGATYVVAIQVKDIDGFTSSWTTKIIGVQDNQAPVAAFTLDVNTMDYNAPVSNKVNDFSFDLDADPITPRWWVTYNNSVNIGGVQKNTGDLFKDYGSTKPNINELVNHAKINGKNIKFTIHLTVIDNPVGRGAGLPAKTSNEATQDLDIGTNNPPIAMFDLQKSAMIKGDMNIITDRSYDPDGDSIEEYYWSVIDKATGVPLVGYDNEPNKPNLSSLNNGLYTIKLQVKDRPIWGEPKVSNIYSKDLAIVEKSLAVDANPKFIEWTNQPINVLITVQNGYNYKDTQWKWSKESLKPTTWDGINTSKTFNVSLSNTVANEGMWYLHMMARDELEQVYNYRYYYKLDVTAPEVTFNYNSSAGTGDLSVIDLLSGLYEAKFKWSTLSAWEDDNTGFTQWNGSSELTKPPGTLYLHVYAKDNAGNITRKVLGPYKDSLKLVNYRITKIVNPPSIYSYPIYITEMPVSVKAGYKVTFQVDLVGIADTIIAELSDSNGNNLGTGTLTKVADIDATTSTWEYSYATKLTTPINTIIFTNVTAYKGSATYDYKAKNSWNGQTLRISGNALEDAQINRVY